MANLYEITAEMMQLQDMLSDTDIDQEVLVNTLESVQFDFEEKAESYAKVIRNMESDSDAYKQEARRLTDKAAVIDNGINRLKSTLKAAMEVTGHLKIKGDLFTVAVQKNGGVQPLNITGDVPEEYKKVIYETDNAAIRKALADGKELDFAVLGERGTSLRIK